MKTVFIIVLLAVSTLTFAKEQWDLAFDDDGIKVYTRENTETNFKDFSAFVTINANFKQVAEHFYNVEGHNDWIHKRTLTQIIKPIDELSSIVYFVTEAPWPLNDRDTVASYVFTKNTDNHIHIEVNTVAKLKPHTPHMVRVPFIKSHWDITKIDDQNTQVEFTSAADPGGNIPSFIANSAVIDMPYHSLFNLRNMIAGNSDE